MKLEVGIVSCYKPVPCASPNLKMGLPFGVFVGLGIEAGSVSEGHSLGAMGTRDRVMRCEQLGK